MAYMQVSALNMAMALFVSSFDHVGAAWGKRVCLRVTGDKMMESKHLEIERNDSLLGWEELDGPGHLTRRSRHRLHPVRVLNSDPLAPFDLMMG